MTTATLTPAQRIASGVVTTGVIVAALLIGLCAITAPHAPSPPPMGVIAAPAPAVIAAPPIEQPSAFKVQQAENARELNAEVRGGMPMRYATGDIDQDISDLVDSRIDAAN